jgi:hypothetical protein
MGLADDDVRYGFDRTLPLRLPSGETVPVRGQRLTVTAAVVLEAEVAYDDWTRLLASGACALEGVESPPGFDPGRPVHLVMLLQPDAAAPFNEADALAQSLLGDEASPLRASQAWVADEATQRFEVPGVDDGWTEIGWRR